MPKRNKFVEGLRKRQQAAAAAERAAQPAPKAPEAGGDAERPGEAKVLVERAPALWPTKKRRPSWK